MASHLATIYLLWDSNFIGCNQMSVVVLLGGWTAGKTSVMKRLQSSLPESFLFLDTDEMVSDHFAGCIYNVFLAYALPGNLAKVSSYIDFRERFVLSKLLEIKSPCVIAAGPLIPTREPFWSAFLHHVKPTCFYLKATPEEMYQGLKKRRAWQQQVGLDHCAGFGSWDQDLLTSFNEATLTWDELGKEEALHQISKAIARLTPRYEKACTNNKTFSASALKRDAATRDNFEQLIANHLGYIRTEEWVA